MVVEGSLQRSQWPHMSTMAPVPTPGHTSLFFFQNPQQYSSLYKTSTSNLEALGCSEHPGAPQGVPDKLHMEIPSQLFQDLIISA